MSETVLEVHDVTKVFHNKRQGDLLAVDHVSFSIARGECLGLVGNSGCGKSSMAHMIAGLMKPTSGTIRLENDPITSSKHPSRLKLTDKVQMVFQNPTSSFNPRRTLGQSCAEALINKGVPKREAFDRVKKLFENCGLPARFTTCYPREVSTGQCQRAAISRALGPRPSLIVLDEPTSALDASIQTQIIDLLGQITKKYHVSYLFICHNLALVKDFCDRVLIMSAGRIIEEGLTAHVLSNPAHPHTRKLIEAALL